MIKGKCIIEWKELTALWDRFPSSYPQESNEELLKIRWFDPRLKGPQRLIEIIKRIRNKDDWTDVLIDFPYIEEIPNSRDLRGIRVYRTPDVLGKYVDWMTLYYDFCEVNPDDLNEIIFAGAWDSFNFEKVNLSYANLELMSLRHTSFNQARMTGINLSESDLVESSFKGAIIDNANLCEADLSLSDFTGAVLKNSKLNSARLDNSNLRMADITGVDLRKVQMTRSLLHDTLFLNTNLEGAYLMASDAFSAKFIKTNLRKTNLKFVRFDYSILKDCDISYAEVYGAHFKAALTIKNLVHENCSFRKPQEDNDIQNNLPQNFFELYPSSPSIFLSYASPDKELVLYVDTWLRNRGARVFMDDRNFLPGKNIREEILRWIEQAGVVVCFISENSKDRPYPSLEREIAETLRLKGKTSVIYFNLDSTIIDLIHESRIYIQGHTLTFEDACEKLWQGIMQLVVTAKDVDLTIARKAGRDWTKKNILNNIKNTK